MQFSSKVYKQIWKTYYIKENGDKTKNKKILCLNLGLSPEARLWPHNKFKVFVNI